MYFASVNVRHFEPTTFSRPTVDDRTKMLANVNMNLPAWLAKRNSSQISLGTWHVRDLTHKASSLALNVIARPHGYSSTVTSHC